MEFVPYLQYIMALVVVLGLIAILTVAARKFGMVPKADKHLSDKKRLGVTNVISIDAKRRLVLVRRDNQEHLLLLGPERDLVIEQNIPVKKKPAQTTNAEEMEEGVEDHEPRLPTMPIRHKRSETSV